MCAKSRELETTGENTGGANSIPLAGCTQLDTVVGGCGEPGPTANSTQREQTLGHTLLLLWKKEGHIFVFAYFRTKEM